MPQGKTLINFITAMEKLLHSQTIAIVERPIRRKKGARLCKELISTIHFSAPPIGSLVIRWKLKNVPLLCQSLAVSQCGISYKLGQNSLLFTSEVSSSGKMFTLANRLWRSNTEGAVKFFVWDGMGFTFTNMYDINKDLIFEKNANLIVFCWFE